MSRLTNLSLAHRTVVLLLALLTIGVGVYAATALRQELIPAFDLPRGAVLTVYPGASPEVVEDEVSKPIEAAVKGVEGITTVTSTSSSSVSQVSMEWEYGYTPDEIAADVRSAIEQIRATLPTDVDPRVITGSFDDIPVMILALSSDADAETVSRQAKDTVVPELKGLPGVRDVTLAGQEAREVIITYDEAKLRDQGVDPALIGQLFGANGTAIPSGTIRTDAVNLDVQTGTTFASVKDVAGLWLQGTDGPVRLSDVATIAEEPVQATTISRVNGRPALTLSITKTAGANTVSVGHEVNAAVERLSEQLGGGTTFAVVFDQAPYIEQSIDDLTVEGGIGLAMAVLVIMLFLGSLRPTLITAVSIPLALLIALAGLWVSGYTLNILTLGALTVAIGRVVDDSIVVIENIKRHQAMGETGRASIIAAVREVAGAVTSSTLTTVAVFLPIGLVGGQAGELFRPFALAVTIALLASLLVSLTVIPVLASWFMRPTARQLADPDAEAKETNTWLHRAYTPALGWALRHRAITLLVALAIFAGTIALTPMLKTDFIGAMGQESLQISQKLPIGTGLAQTDAATRRIETILESTPQVDTYQTSIGGSTAVFLGRQADTNQATFTVTLLPGSEPAEVASRLREQVADAGEELGTVEVAVGTNQASQVALYVESDDPEALAAANQQVLDLMKSLPDLTNPASDLSAARELLQVDVDEETAAKKGMTQAAIGQAVARAVRGQLLGNLTTPEGTLEVYLRSRKPVQNLDELRDVVLPVTQRMTMDARLKAADKVTARQEALADDAQQQAADAYDEQVSALRKQRRQAVDAQRDLSRQLDRAKRDLRRLQGQLAEVPQQCAVPPADPTQLDPDCYPVTAGVLRLSQELSAAGSQVAQLSAGLAQSRAGVSQLDKQLDGLSESRRAQLDAQSEQEQLADDAKQAQEAEAKPVRLKDVADVKLVDAPATITRVNAIRAATLTATAEGGDLGATTTAIEQGIAGLDLPDGVTVRIGGVSQQQQQSFGQLTLAMLVAIAVVYLIMVATFGSLLQPLILLVSVPFAATGALGLSLATDTPIGVPSMIGLLMLIGIVVTNAIVLIDLINQKRRAGAGIEESIAAGARLRLRPIVMTALATIFALIPMALGFTGGGVFISRPLAIVVIGGLVSSTLLTLILVPVLYDLLENWRKRQAERRVARREARLARAQPVADEPGAPVAETAAVEPERP